MRTIVTAEGHLEDGRQVGSCHVWEHVRNTWDGVEAAADDALAGLQAEVDKSNLANRIRGQRETRLKHFYLEVTYEYDLPVVPPLHTDIVDKPAI